MFANPIKILKTLGLKEDNIVVDLGAGTGFYSVLLGQFVPRGKVYAIEVEKDFLEAIKGKVREAHLNNVEIIWGNVENVGGTKLGKSIADVVVASNILFQVEDKSGLISEVKRILKQKGKVLLVDWQESSILGKKRIIPREKAKEMFEKDGFVFEREIDAGAHHYGMILTKS